MQVNETDIPYTLCADTRQLTKDNPLRQIAAQFWFLHAQLRIIQCWPFIIVCYGGVLRTYCHRTVVNSEEVTNGRVFLHLTILTGCSCSDLGDNLK